jgi:cysteine-rich repeat protein
VTSDEICDDGNTLGGDGCSADCKQMEPGWVCRMPGKTCTPDCLGGGSDAGDCMTCPSVDMDAGVWCDGGVLDLSGCGDGIVEPGEQCDNARTNGAGYGEHGCTAACTLSHYCGDGFVDGDHGEECDLGPLNLQTGQLCDSNCKAVNLVF